MELDKDRKNQVAVAIDIGGADKMVCFPDGGLAFLGQRFRRWEQRKYDDFTLRKDRPSGTLTEFGKIKLALQRGGFIAGYYAYGHANETENGFIRFRILKFKELVDAIIAGEYQPKTERNPNGSSTFYALPFNSIPPRFFLINYAEDKPQLRLSF
jgi:hypothetical protein